MKKDCKVKKPPLEKPGNASGEIDANLKALLQKHYNDIIGKMCFERHVFKFVIKGNKTLISLIAGALTGFSTNVLTGFLDFGDYDCIKKIHVSIILIFALVLNVVVILFAARIAQVQEAGESFRTVTSLTVDRIRAAEYNLVYAECYANKRYLKSMYILSVVFTILTILALLIGKQIITGVISWLSCLQ